MRSHGADLTNAYMDVKPEEKQEIRIEKVSRMLEQRIEVLRLSHEIGQQTKAGIEERQREILLHEQPATIRRQLGEGDGGKAAEIAEQGRHAQLRDEARRRSRRWRIGIPGPADARLPVMGTLEAERYSSIDDPSSRVTRILASRRGTSNLLRGT
jgi:hypothetical protein